MYPLTPPGPGENLSAHERRVTAELGKAAAAIGHGYLNPDEPSQPVDTEVQPSTDMEDELQPYQLGEITATHPIVRLARSRFDPLGFRLPDSLVAIVEKEEAIEPVGGRPVYTYAIYTPDGVQAGADSLEGIGRLLYGMKGGENARILDRMQLSLVEETHGRKGDRYTTYTVRIDENGAARRAA